MDQTILKQKKEKEKKKKRAFSSSKGTMKWRKKRTTPRLILLGLVSARKASVTPVMGSLGAVLTCSHHPKALLELDMHLFDLLNLPPMNLHMIMIYDPSLKPCEGVNSKNASFSVQVKEGVGGGDLELESSPFPWFFSARLPLFQWAPWFCFSNPTAVLHFPIRGNPGGDFFGVKATR